MPKAPNKTARVMIAMPESRQYRFKIKVAKMRTTMSRVVNDLVENYLQEKVENQD
jgi:ParG